MSTLDHFIRKLFLVLIAFQAVCANAGVWSPQEMLEYTGYNSYYDQESPFSSRQKQAVHSYVLSPKINMALRSQSQLDQDQKKLIHNIDGTLTKFRFPHDLVLFRGVSLEYRSQKPYKIDEEFNDLAYTSSTINLDTAKKFAKHAMYILYSPQDFNALWIGNNSVGGEGEVLLPRNTKFKIMNTRFQGDAYIQIVQICASECDKTMNRVDVEEIFKTIP